MFKQAKVDNAQPWSEWKTWHAISQTLLISLKQKSTMIAGSIFRIFILLSIQNFKAPEVRGQLNPQEPGTLNHIQKIG